MYYYYQTIAFPSYIVMGFGSWFLGIHLGLGLVGVWIAYTLDVWVRGSTMVAHWFRLGWVKQAVASRKLVTRAA